MEHPGLLPVTASSRCWRYEEIRWAAPSAVLFLDMLIPEGSATPRKPPFYNRSQEVFTTAKRVLIVDDEPVIADTLVIIFVKAGYHARSAYSAEEALEVIPLWRPDLAIIDVILPNMNGIDLALKIKAEAPECRLSLFSGASHTADLIAAAPYSFEVHAKPVHPREMLALASRLLS
jgi:CheY-like chemotaxis protein